MPTERRGYSLKVQQGQAPSTYSPEYRAWRSAVLRKDDRAIAETDKAWKHKFLRAA